MSDRAKHLTAASIDSSSAALVAGPAGGPASIYIPLRPLRLTARRAPRAVTPAAAASCPCDVAVRAAVLRSQRWRAAALAQPSPAHHSGGTIYSMTAAARWTHRRRCAGHGGAAVWPAHPAHRGRPPWCASAPPLRHSEAVQHPWYACVVSSATDYVGDAPALRLARPFLGLRQT